MKQSRVERSRVGGGEGGEGGDEEEKRKGKEGEGKKRNEMINVVVLGGGMGYGVW